jgi:PAS domain S-box-containing protein
VSGASVKNIESKRKKTTDIQFANVIEKINEGFVALDAQMNYTYINKRGSELLKRKPEDLLGKNYWEEYPQDKDTAFGQAYLRALETQTPVEIEDYYAPGDRWFENRIYPSADGLSIFFSDVTERKLAEEQLSRTASFDEAVMSNMGEGLYTVDSEGLVTSLNPAAEKLFGWTLDELRGRRMHDVTHYQHPDGTPFPAEDCAGFQVLHHGQILADYEDVFIRKDGTFFNVVYSSSPLWENGEINGLVVVFRNITERKRDEDALRTSEARLRIATQTARMFTWEFDLQKQISTVADNFADAVGFSADLIPKDNREILQRFIHPEDTQLILETLTKAIQSRSDLPSVQYRILNPESGQPIWLEMNGKIIYDSDGNPGRLFGVAQNISESKQAENRLTLLAEVSELLRTFENPIELTFAVSKAVGEHLHVRRCLFNEIDLERDLEIVHRDYCNGVESVAGEHKVSDYSSLTSAEVAAGKTVVNTDSKNDARTAADYERSYAPQGERAYVAVPLMRENRWVGSLWVSDDVPRQWSKEDVSLLETIAERTWTVIEKLRINAALSESEEKSRRIVETANEGIWEINGDTRTVFVNPRMAEMLGYTAEEMMGRSSFDFIFPEENADDESRLAHAKSGIPLKSREFRFRRKDGSELWTFVTSSPQLDQDGNFIGSTAMIADMTERRRMEDERDQLLEREQAQRASAEQAKIEAEQAWVEAERELAERKLAEAALGEWADAPLPQDKRPAWLRFAVAILVTLTAVLIRALFNPVLGDALALVTIYGAVAFSVWYGGVGPAILSVLLGYVAITGLIIEPRDVFLLNAQNVTGLALFLFSNTVVMALGETMRRAQRHAHQSARVAVKRQHQAETQLREKQLAEQSLRQSEALYRGIARSIPGGGVYVVDKDFRYLVAEGPATDVFGLSRERLEGHTVSEVFSKELAESTEARLQRNFAGETVNFETRHNGRVYWTQQAPMLDSLGSVDHAIIMTIDITDRKQIEEALRRSEERFVLFMQHLPGLAWIKDTEGRYVYANAAAEKAFNTPRENLYGRTDEDIFPPEVAAQFRKNDELALMDEKGVQVTETLEQEDGILHYSLVNKFPIPGPDGGTALIGGTAFDVTKRRQAEEALRESEARLRAVFDGTYEYIGLLSPDGTLLEANRAALEFDNNTREEVVGRPFWETPWWLYTPGAPETLRETIGQAASGEFIRYEAPLNRRSGETVIFDFSMHPVRDENGKVVFLVPEGRNITDRKHAEEALRESEERFRAILRQATAGIVRKDVEGRFIFVNEAFCNMLGYTEAELLGKTIWQFTHPDDLDENKRLYDRTMVEGIPFKLEKRLLRKDGLILWVDVSVSPIMDVTGKPQSAVAVEVDITGRKQAEEALQQLNLQLESRVQKRTVELQTANQSLREEITERQRVEDALHESRKRLQILSQRLVDVQEEERRAIARELHDRVGQSLSALNINLVILDNQISKHVPQEISVRLDDSVQLVAETINLVRDVMSDLRPPVLDDYGLEAALQSHVDSFKSRYDIDVQFEKPDQLLPRLGSSIEMTFLRIAQEALINVARHARANQINLSLTRDENAVRLIVEDNGTGITSWQQANRPGSHGLTIMRERAEAFGGELEVSSVPGKGTKVEATIPIGVGGQDNIQKERSE